MSISITGRIIKAKSKDDVTGKTGKKPRHWFSLDHSHIRVQFSDGSSKHFLFTNSQIARAIKNAKKHKDILPKTSWVKEFWYSNVIEQTSKDIEDVISRKQLPLLAKRYNHIRIELSDKERHLLFSHKDMQKALERAENNTEVLPKLSWVIL